MIRIQSNIDRNGVLRLLKADGHAGNQLAGQNPVCAGVTVLLRTTARWLEKENGLEVSGENILRGSIVLELKEYPESRRERLKGVTDYFFMGILDLEREFPLEISVTIDEYKEF